MELSHTPPAEAETVKLHVSLELKVCNNGKKVIISKTPTIAPAPNPSLIKALKTAYEIKQQYMATDAEQLSVIAKDMKMDKRHVWRTLKLAFLTPDIQLAILSGMQPRTLILKDFLYQAIPTSWEDQRTALGF
ncbi:MAG: hypothetical protein ABJG88_05805 [Litorimonas sp.]